MTDEKPTVDTERDSLFQQLERARGFLEPLCLELGDIRFTEALPLLRRLKAELAQAKVRISNQDALLVNCRANRESLARELAEAKQNRATLACELSDTILAYEKELSEAREVLRKVRVNARSYYRLLHPGTSQYPEILYDDRAKASTEKGPGDE